MIWNRSDDECHRLVDTYAEMMKHELDENWPKGDREVWATHSKDDGLAEVQYHVDKLVNAVALDEKERVKEYAVDVANCAMIFLDMMGMIEPAPVKQPPPPKYVRNYNTDYMSS